MGSHKRVTTQAMQAGKQLAARRQGNRRASWPGSSQRSLWPRSSQARRASPGRTCRGTAESMATMEPLIWCGPCATTRWMAASVSKVTNPNPRCSLLLFLSAGPGPGVVGLEQGSMRRAGLFVVAKRSGTG